MTSTSMGIGSRLLKLLGICVLIVFIVGSVYVGYRAITYQHQKSQEISCIIENTCGATFPASVVIFICGEKIGYGRESFLGPVVEEKTQSMKTFFPLVGTSFEGQCLGDVCTGDKCNNESGVFYAWVNGKQVGNIENILVGSRDVIVLSFQERSKKEMPESARQKSDGPYYYFANATTGDVGESSAWFVDPLKSTITWHGSTLLTEHQGSISIKGTPILYGNIASSKISGDIVIDMTTLNTTSLPGNENVLLTNHLKSADFFDVQQYPEARFEFLHAEKLHDSDMYTVTGNVTIKDVTYRVKFPAVVSHRENQSMDVNAHLVLDRTKFHVKYLSSALGVSPDNAIRNEIIIDVQLHLKAR